MAGRIIGYAREHHRLASVDNECASLKAEGCDTIFADRYTRGGQPELEKLFDLAEAGDVIIVTSIDQIAGSLFELVTNLKRISAKSCHFRSLAEPWIDSLSSTGALTLTILNALSSLDRNFKRIAAAKGRSESSSKGTHLGRYAKLSAGQIEEAIARREAGESPANIASSYGVSRTTIVRLIRQK